MDVTLEVRCMSCAKKFVLEPGDPQYRKLKAGQTKLYVCKTCNNAIQEEAIQSTGIDPKLLDPDGHDKLVP